MKTLIKQALSLAVIIYIVWSITLTTVLADNSEYMRVVKDGVLIYADSDLSEPLFEIPKTYYVKIENRLGAVVKISYGDGSKDCPVIIGYVNQSDLSLITTEPTSPFFIIKVSTDTSDILFNDVELKNPYFNLPKNEIMYYYGDVNINDKVLCYVYYNKKLGYVDKTCLNPFSVTPNPDPLEESTPSTPEQSPSISEDNKVTFQPGENLQLIIIVGISVVSISVVYFLFKPQKNKTADEQNEFYSEN